jgi:S1-C subfamily serine protease
VQLNRTYRLGLLTADKKVFWVDFSVLRYSDGLKFLVADINPELANALALEKRRGGVAIFANDRRLLMSLELSESAGAIREVFHCRRDVLATETAHEQPARNDDGKGESETEHYGTGFFVARQYVLTNNHVIQGCNEGWVRYPDYKPERAYIAGSDETNDLVLLRTEMINQGWPHSDLRHDSANRSSRMASPFLAC